VCSNKTRDTDSRIVDHNPQRERGILTPHDRAFLLADEGEDVREGMEPGGNAERQKRHKIRNRFRNALVDIQYLLLLEDEDLSLLFPSDRFDGYERGIVHGSVLAAVYNMIRADTDREEVLNILGELVANDIVREYAEEHGVYASNVSVEVDVPPAEECPRLEAVRAVLEDGEEIPTRAHMALEYGGIHPNAEEPP